MKSGTAFLYQIAIQAALGKHGSKKRAGRRHIEVLKSGGISGVLCHMYIHMYLFFFAMQQRIVVRSKRFVQIRNMPRNQTVVDTHLPLN